MNDRNKLINVDKNDRLVKKDKNFIRENLKGFTHEMITNTKSKERWKLNVKYEEETEIKIQNRKWK